MRKKLLFIGLVLAFATLLLTGCNPPEHECQFSSEWTYDSNNPQKGHWQVCDECGKTNAPVAHSFGTDKQTKAPTCTEEGIKTSTCSVCGYTKTESIEKTTDVHPYEKAWTTNSTHHWHKVTCIHDNQVMNYSEHNWGSWETVKPATSTEDGRKERCCIICGYTEAQVIEKTGSEHIHTYSENWSSDNMSHWHPATCEHSDLFTDKANHTFNSGTVTKAATTAEEGIMTYHCTVCEYEKTESIPIVIEEHTHNFNIKNTGDKFKFRDADCENPASYYYSCSCGEHNGETFESGTALGHSFTNYFPNNDATCTADGTKTAKCNRCNATETKPDVGSMLNHSYIEQVVSDKYFASHADCTHSAMYYYSCVCGEMSSTKFEFGNPLGHSFTDYASNNDATCDKDGTKTAKCGRCGETKTISDVGTKLPHTYSTSWSSDDTHHWHSATCMHSALTSDKEPHNWEDTGKILTVATESIEGVKEQKCSICGKTRNVNTGKLDHVHSFSTEWTYDEISHWHSATCGHTVERQNQTDHEWNAGLIVQDSTIEEEGVLLKTCTVCGCQIEFPIPAKESFTVCFYDGKNLLETQKVAPGTNVEYLGKSGNGYLHKDSSVEYDYQFEKWVTEENGDVEADLTNVSTNLQIFAKYNQTKRKYTVAFYSDLKDESNKNIEIELVTVEYGTRLGYIPDLPLRDGYRSNGWNIELSADTEITCDCDIVAKPYVKVWRVDFVDYDGTTVTKVVDNGDTVKAPEFSDRTGYTFVGWDQDFSKPSADLLVHAVYEVKKFKVTFRYPNGDEIETQTVAFGFHAIEPLSYQKYYFNGNKATMFSGWIDQGNNGVQLTDFEIADHVTLTAKYENDVDIPVITYIADQNKMLQLCITLPSKTKLFAIDLRTDWTHLDGNSRSINDKYYNDNIGYLFADSSLRVGNDQNCTSGDEKEWFAYSNIRQYFTITWACGNGHSVGTNRIMAIQFGGADVTPDMFTISEESRFIIGESYDKAYSVKPEMIFLIKE